MSITLLCHFRAKVDSGSKYFFLYCLCLWMSFVFSTCTENYNCDYNNRSYNFVDKALKMFMSGCFLSTYSIVEEALLHCARVLALFCLVWTRIWQYAREWLTLRCYGADSGHRFFVQALLQAFVCLCAALSQGQGSDRGSGTGGFHGILDEAGGEWRDW